ncbi:MAG TPA: M15 family metallopeptidase [Polyangiaceae bacterium]
MRAGGVLLVGAMLASACGRSAPTASASSTSTTSSTSTSTPTPTPTASATASATPNPTPFGAPTAIPKFACPVVLPGGPFRSFLSPADTRVAFVDGNDLLALANRSPTGALPPSYEPTDLVDLRDLSPRKPWECDGGRDCLRREAAQALHKLLDAMRTEGIPGRVESAYRGFHTQCWVFDGWAAKAHAGFCEATTQSALPGHSQHQLGTTVDMFTVDWATRGPVFRDGFGCTAGGKWLDEEAWRFGFVVPYPIDPDDRKDGSRCAQRWDRPVPIDPKTGYKHEPWHLRFIGEDAAARYHAAWLASHPGTPAEITLEQWLRAQRGLEGDAELPVCDGCQCGACATMASDGDKSPCADASLRLDENGRAVAPADEPHLLDASVDLPDGGVAIVRVRVHVPAHTPTQPPVTTDREPTYAGSSTFAALVPYPGTQAHDYEDLPGAWRVAIEPSPPGSTRWPWRASIARDDLEPTWNRANLVLPSGSGDLTVSVRIAPPQGVTSLRVTLLKSSAEHDTRDIALPTH